MAIRCTRNISKIFMAGMDNRQRNLDTGIIPAYYHSCSLYGYTRNQQSLMLKPGGLVHARSHPVQPNATSEVQFQESYTSRDALPFHLRSLI